MLLGPDLQSMTPLYGIAVLPFAILLGLLLHEDLMGYRDRVWVNR